MLPAPSHRPPFRRGALAAAVATVFCATAAALPAPDAPVNKATRAHRNNAFRNFNQGVAVCADGTFGVVREASEAADPTRSAGILAQTFTPAGLPFSKKP